MTKRPYRTPLPRQPVASPDLSRPDWTKPEDRNPDRLWLDKNENSDPELAALVAKVFAETPPQVLFSYPDSARLYNKLAGYLGVSAENLILAAGSDGVIRSVFEAFVSQGDVVIHTDPTFAIAGVDWPDDVKLYLPIAGRLGIKKIKIINDSLAALYSVSDSLEGIVTIAGTGGKTAGIYRGKMAQSMGMELGEGGGAGKLVGLALEYMAMQFHHTAANSALYEVIPKIMGKQPGKEFFEAVARNGLRLNESLAPEIFKLADLGDEGALYAIKKTAIQHAKDVCGIATQLNIKDEPITVVREIGRAHV